jgi:hypothetical protein
MALPALVAAVSARARNRGPLAARLGCYFGFPHGNSAAAMAAFERRFDGFVAAMGGNRPRFMNAFTASRADFGDQRYWVGSARWVAWSWTRTMRTHGIIPVVGVPMARPSDQAEARACGAALSVFAASAADQLDWIWSGIAERGATMVGLRCFFAPATR